MTRVAVATTSQLAADAAAEVADAGGNAVDSAVAAALLTMNTEPGVCALAGSAFVTIWPADADPVTIDGNVAIPGYGNPAFDPGTGIQAVQMEYGGGVKTLVGAASVAVPGSLASLELANRKFGRLPWKTLVEPSVRATRQGFPLSSACHHYLQYSGDPVFSRSTDGYQALHDAHGKLRRAGSRIRVPHLADSLELIGTLGSRVFYRGELARRIIDHVQDNGGLLTADDMRRYEPVVRPALTVDISGWTVATNPPPAIGGAVLCAMLLGFKNTHFTEWDATALLHLIAVQNAVLGYRTDVLDVSDDVIGDIEALLAQARSGKLNTDFVSASTVHTSAVDSTGLACAITASSGYGSGEMPDGTGIWLNNCLGELELNRNGVDAGPIGSRLPSNMAPSVARCGDIVLAAGTPGADRITTALHQFLVNFVQMNMSLEHAVSQSRMHLELRGPAPVLAVEPGLNLPEIPIRVNSYPEKGMYFGGVGVALFDSANGFDVAADPRREGGTWISNT
jgi:gamma-glutamyltranspeptidase / glutathione hydrolase